MFRYPRYPHMDEGGDVPEDPGEYNPPDDMASPEYEKYKADYKTKYDAYQKHLKETAPSTDRGGPRGYAKHFLEVITGHSDGGEIHQEVNPVNVDFGDPLGEDHPDKSAPIAGGYAFGGDVKMHASKPQSQAVAIAFSKKREAERRHKMWLGGQAAGGPTDTMKEEPHPAEASNIFAQTDYTSFSDPDRDRLIEEPHSEEEPDSFSSTSDQARDSLTEEPQSLATALKRRRRGRMYG